MQTIIKRPAITETIPVIGAKFKLYRNNEEKGTYTTDSLGKIIINGLYLFDENKNMDQNYTLKEVFIPEGYTKTKDISFKVQMIDSTLTMITDNMLSYKVENNTIKMKVEDSKSFKLVKKDGETNALLPNVKFALFNEDDGEVPARNSKGDILGTKELEIDVENMSPADVVNKINTMADSSESLLRRVIRLEKLVKRFHII